MKYDFDTIIPRRGTNSYKWDTPEEENVLRIRKSFGACLISPGIV